MKFNFFYLFAAALGIALFVVTPVFYRGSSDTIPAVTYAKDHKLTAEFVAQVRKVWVKPGQQINPGDTLIELYSPALQQEIHKLSLQLSSVRSDRVAQTRSMRSSLNLAGAEIRLEIAELENQIRVFENELSLNRRISGAVSKGNQVMTPVEIKIRDLKDQVDIRKQELTHREEEIRNRYNVELNQYNNREVLIKSEMEVLDQKVAGLIRVAGFSGVIESVYVKSGEVVEEFTDLISVLPSSPVSVVAYLASGLPAPAIGTEVIVSSAGFPASETKGKIIGLGSIVPLPDILQKATAVKAFGKEIFVEIQSDNTFSTGEKVLVRI
jgi:HlyD family secretion protein